MRIEQHHGYNIVCGHIFPLNELKVGSVWVSSGNTTVTIKEIDGEWITYNWIENGNEKSHSKDWFSFQCRYCLIV